MPEGIRVRIEIDVPPAAISDIKETVDKVKSIVETIEKLRPVLEKAGAVAEIVKMVRGK